MNTLKHIHILGICGTFMGGIAAIAKQAGYRVTGCDANVYPPMSTQLEAQGIELIEGFGVDQLDLKPDDFVIGTGETHAVSEFVKLAFAEVGILDWKKYVTIDARYKRPAEVPHLRARATKAQSKLVL